MTEYNQNFDRELGWDDEIEKEGGDFIILPAGTYPFKIESFTRGRFAGSEKMPACNRAELEITIYSPEHGEVTIKESLLLHSKTEWKLSEFFISIGQKRTGEKVRMNWGMVIGATGMAEIEVNKYTDKNGNERENNRVKKFLEPENAPQQQPSYQAPVNQNYQQKAQQPAYQPPQQQPSQPNYQQPFPTNTPPVQPGGYQPGSF